VTLFGLVNQLRSYGSRCVCCVWSASDVLQEKIEEKIEKGTVDDVMIIRLFHSFRTRADDSLTFSVCTTGLGEGGEIKIE
jgi:hypothetical protein